MSDELLALAVLLGAYLFGLGPGVAIGLLLGRPRKAPRPLPPNE